MKWLTREWARGELSDGEAAARWEGYLKRQAEIATSRLTGLGQLARQADPRLRLDDAKVERIRIDPMHRSVVLELVQGDVEVGYGLLRVEFVSATIAPDAEAIQSFLADPRSEVWYFEVDREDRPEEGSVLRLLMWPQGEIHIQFADLRWSWSSRADRTLDGDIGRVDRTSRMDP
jgi:hypothetical protein